DDEGVVLDTQLAQAAQELAERRVPFVQCVEVAREVILAFEGPGPCDFIRIVSCDRQIREEEALPLLERCNPLKRPPYRRRVVDSEARIHLAADCARVFEELEPAMIDYRRHAEIVE